MDYPLISEYVEAVKAAVDNFDQLKNLRPVLSEDGEPVMSGGNFAVVFKMKDEQTGKLHAVKCFLKEQESRAEAYRLIAEELEYVSSTFLTPIKYLDKELFVDTNTSDETEFPVLLMDWVEGQTLDKYIREHIDDQYELSLLAYQFSRLAMWLMPQPFAHGDLKPDNILVRNDGTLALVDYDGMYVPAMKGEKARELGSPDFRHPSRTEDVFDEHIDDYSLVSILLSLKAIALQPKLLEQYGAKDRLLFSANDYLNLSESQVMDAIKTMMQDSDLATLYSLFILSSAQNNLSQASFRLLDLSKPRRPQEFTWSPFDEAYSLKDIWEITNPGLYDEIDGNVAVVVAVELSNGNFALRISIPLKNGLNKELKISPKSELDEGDIVLISTIRGQEFHKEGSNPIVRYDGQYISTEVTEDELIRAWKDENGVKYSKDKTKLLLVPKYFKGDCIIRNGTNVICDNAFNLLRNELQSWNVQGLNGQISSVVIPNSVYIIGARAFMGCAGLTSIELPNNIIEIGRSAFRHCCCLESVIIPNGVRIIGLEAFYGCEELTTITLPDSLVVVGNHLFFNCKSLKTIFIPSGSTAKFERLLPEYKDKLVEQEVSENLSTEVTDDDLANAWTDKYGVVYSKDGLRLLKGENCNSENYFVKEGTKVICDLAFAECSSIKTISLPESLASIGDYAFDGCWSISSITIPSKVSKIGINPFNRTGIYKYICISPFYKTDGVALYDKDVKRLISVCRSIETIVIPESIVEIGESAFCDCHLLQSLSIPDNVSEIKKKAFHYCRSLKKVTLPYSLVCLEDEVFNGCESLQSIKIPDDISFIGNNTFEGCFNLETILIPESVFQIGHYAFSVCESLRTINIPEGVCFIGVGAFSGCSSLESITLPQNNYSILDHAFSDCSSLKSISIPNSINEIGTSAFYGCQSLESLIIPSSVRTIGDSAFTGCYSLKNVTIQDGVISIGGSAFSHCESLERINIPDSIISFGDLVDDGYTSWNGGKASAFDFCKSLHSIVVPIGSKEKFKRLLPDYKDKLIEQEQGWTVKDMRSFNAEEIALVKRAEVVASDYGNSVCFFMQTGGQTFIPLSKQSKLTVGEELDIRTAKLITLCREGKADITRVIE